LACTAGCSGPRWARSRFASEQFDLLAKSLRPLPRGKSYVRDDGTSVDTALADPEVRYRQRYADLAVHAEVREIFRVRAKAISYLRRFLDERSFLEVETPILQSLYGGAAARPFVTHHNALDMPLYLRIADELYLKRLLVGVWSGSTRSGTTSATRAWTGPTIPSSPCSSSTRPTPITRR